MANLNKVMLIGNLTRDPEMKYLPKGTAVAEFGLAVGRKYKTESGDLKEETMFVDISVFGRSAEIAKEYLTKGKNVYVEGRLQLDTWDDKQTGQKRSKHRIFCENFQMLGGRGDSAESGGGGGGGGRSTSSSSSEDEYDQRPPARSQSSSQGGGGGGSSQQRPKPKPAPVSQDDDDDIPF